MPVCELVHVGFLGRGDELTIKQIRVETGMDLWVGLGMRESGVNNKHPKA